MPNIALSWQSSGALAAVCLLVASITPRLVTDAGRRGLQFAAFGSEVGIVLGLYSLWQLAGGVSLGQIADADQRGLWIWRTERAWHLPNEAGLQPLLLHHPVFAQACNIYYATMHFGMLLAVLLWLYIRHRDAYRRTRTLIVLTTSACLLLGLWSVAPPRLVDVGMIDTAARFHQSVYAVTAQLGPDQYAAMPSVHVAWAGLVALAVIRGTRSKWRWLILLHFAATMYVVAATANHFWLDGLVALALLGISSGVQQVSRRIYFERRFTRRQLGAAIATSDVDLLELHDPSPSR